MNSGNFTFDFCPNNKCDIMDMLKFELPFVDQTNYGYVKAVSDNKHFGNKQSRNNYEFNKKYPDLYFGKKK